MENKDFESYFISNETNSRNRTNKTLSKNSKELENDFNSSLEDIFQLQNLISKRTNKGRKEIFEIPKDKPKCEVCLVFSFLSKEPLISCSICKCMFHKLCYNQYELISPPNNETKSYRCIRCTHAILLNKSIYDFKCFICGHSNKVLKYNNFREIYYHQICLDNLSELSDLKEEEISAEIIRRWRYKNSCKYCDKKLSASVAVTKCKKPKCKEYYHIPCAIVKGMIFDIIFMKEFYNVSQSNQIPFYCSNHNKKISNQYKAYLIKNMNNENQFIKYSNIINNKKTFPNEKKIIEEDDDGNGNEKKGNCLQDQISTKRINKDKYYNEEKNNYDINENTFEERKENYENMEIDDYYENSKPSFIDMNSDNLLNFDINDKNYNKFKKLESKNDNCDIGFNTKIHYFIKTRGLILKRDKSFEFGV